MISRNSLIYSQKVGIYSAIGLALGVALHITYCLLGIGLIISKSIFIFSILKFVGATYLIYIGWKCLHTKAHQEETIEKQQQKHLTKTAAIRMGFLTNALNPKATLFFLALFTQVIDPKTPKLIQLLYGIEMSIMTFAWFALVAVILSNNSIRARFTALQHWLERSFGLILIALGFKVAFFSSK